MIAWILVWILFSALIAALLALWSANRKYEILGAKYWSSLYKAEDLSPGTKRPEFSFKQFGYEFKDGRFFEIEQ